MQYLVYHGPQGLEIHQYSNMPSVVNAVEIARQGKTVVWVTEPKKLVDNGDKKAFLLLSGSPIQPVTY